MTKYYYLTDDSGTHISISDLHITLHITSTEENNINWTYESEDEVLNALNARISILNDVYEFIPNTSKYFKSLLITVFLSVLIILACFGVEDIVRIYSLFPYDRAELPEYHDYVSHSEHDNTGVGESE